jgi:hypothetical protein
VAAGFFKKKKAAAGHEECSRARLENRTRKNKNINK